MYTNVVYFNYSKGKAAKNNADKAKTLVCGKVKNDIKIRRTKIMYVQYAVTFMRARLLQRSVLSATHQQKSSIK